MASGVSHRMWCTITMMIFYMTHLWLFTRVAVINWFLFDLVYIMWLYRSSSYTAFSIGWNTINMSQYPTYSVPVTELSNSWDEKQYTNDQWSTQTSMFQIEGQNCLPWLLYKKRPVPCVSLRETWSSQLYLRRWVRRTCGKYTPYTNLYTRTEPRLTP